MALARPLNGTPWFLAVEFPEQPLLGSGPSIPAAHSMADLVVFMIGMWAHSALAGASRDHSKCLPKPPRQSARETTHARLILDKTTKLGALAGAFNRNGRSLRRDSQRELERKVQERTLQLEAAPCAMLMVDQKGKVTLVNAQAEQLFGYERK